MVGVLLVMIVGGIGLAQAVSDPRQVTLRWLRLGGIIALCLLAVAWLVVVRAEQANANLESVSNTVFETASKDVSGGMPEDVSGGGGGGGVYSGGGRIGIHGGLTLVMAAFVMQLIAVQRAYRGLGRLAAGSGYVLAAGLVTFILLPQSDHRTGNTTGKWNITSSNLTRFSLDSPHQSPRSNTFHVEHGYHPKQLWELSTTDGLLRRQGHHRDQQ